MARKPKSQAKPTRSKVQPITLPPIITIPLDRLVLSEANVRTVYSADSIADLAHSIAHRGLLQSLSVRPLIDAEGNETSIYEVPAGGRRFRALHLLVKQKRLAADAPIPCILKTEGVAADDSLAENTDRENLHPVDEFRAFLGMKSQGMNDDAIAAAYRVTPAFVRQRLRLASASPAVLEAFKAEDIELDQLMAFCITEDHKRQDAVLEQVMSGHVNAGAYYIKQLLTEDSVRSGDTRVKFVGLEAYEAAGGAVLRDLFSTDAFVRDPDLLNRLVSEKLEAARQEVLTKGWKWATASFSNPYGDKQQMEKLIPLEVELTAKEQKRIGKLEAERDALYDLDERDNQQEARLEEVEAELEAFDNRPPVFAPEDMARAGVFISVNNDGELWADYGYVQAEDVQQADSGEEDGSDGSLTDTQSLADDDIDEATAPGKPIPDSVLQDLTSFKTVAMRNAMANDFNTAFLAVLHALVASHFYRTSTASCLQITAQQSFPANAPGLDTWDTTKAVDKLNDAWRKRLPKNEGDLWHALSAMEITDRQSLFAHCAAGTINAVKMRNAFRGRALDHAEQLVTALGMDMTHSGWTTRADNYFLRVTKPHILQAVAEAKGENTANLISHMKKDTMAVEAERLLAGTNWLPHVLRSPDTHDVGTADNAESATALPAFLATPSSEHDAAA